MSIAEGAVAPPRAAFAQCAHCGLVVPPGLVDPALVDQDAPRQFCCHGCRAVYAVIHEHGLDRYYALRGWDADGVPTPGRLTALGL